MPGACDVTEAQKSLVLLTESQLAERWQISVKTLQAARLTGRGCAFVRIGRNIRYSRATVEHHEAENTFVSTAGGRVTR